MCNNCGCKDAEEEEDVESFDLEEEQAQAIQACVARGYHDFEYTFNPEHFQEWAEGMLADIENNYQDLGLQYPQNVPQYQNQNYGNIRYPPGQYIQYPIFHGVSCNDCGITLEGYDNNNGNTYMMTIEGAEQEMDAVNSVWQDYSLSYTIQQYPQYYNEEGIWNGMGGQRYRPYRNLNLQQKMAAAQVKYAGVQVGATAADINEAQADMESGINQVGSSVGTYAGGIG